MAEETARMIFDLEMRGEQRVERTLDGLVEKMFSAKSATEVAGLAIEKFGRVFEVALPVALIATAAGKIIETLGEMREESSKLVEGMQKIGQVDLNNSSLAELEKTLKEAQKIQEDSSKEGAIGKFLFGDGGSAGIVGKIMDINYALGLARAHRIEQQTNSQHVRATGKDDDDAKAEVIRGEYESKIETAQSGPEKRALAEQEKQAILDMYAKEAAGREKEREKLFEEQLKLQKEETRKSQEKKDQLEKERITNLEKFDIEFKKEDQRRQNQLLIDDQTDEDSRKKKVELDEANLEKSIIEEKIKNAAGEVHGSSRPTEFQKMGGLGARSGGGRVGPSAIEQKEQTLQLMRINEHILELNRALVSRPATAA